MLWEGSTQTRCARFVDCYDSRVEFGGCTIHRSSLKIQRMRLPWERSWEHLRGVKRCQGIEARTPNLGVPLGNQTRDRRLSKTSKTYTGSEGAFGEGPLIGASSDAGRHGPLTREAPASRASASRRGSLHSWSAAGGEEDQSRRICSRRVASCIRRCFFQWRRDINPVRSNTRRDVSSVRRQQRAQIIGASSSAQKKT